MQLQCKRMGSADLGQSSVDGLPIRKQQTNLLISLAAYNINACEKVCLTPRLEGGLTSKLRYSSQSVFSTKHKQLTQFSVTDRLLQLPSGSISRLLRQALQAEAVQARNIM